MGKQTLFDLLLAKFDRKPRTMENRIKQIMQIPFTRIGQNGAFCTLCKRQDGRGIAHYLKC